MELQDKLILALEIDGILMFLVIIFGVIWADRGDYKHYDFEREYRNDDKTKLVQPVSLIKRVIKWIKNVWSK